MDFYLSQCKRIINLLFFTRSVSIHHLVLHTLRSSIEIFVQSTHSWKLVQGTRKIYSESLPSARCHFHIHYNQTFLIRAQNEMAACKYKAVPESHSSCYLLNVPYEMLSALNISWNWEQLRWQCWVVCSTWVYVTRRMKQTYWFPFMFFYFSSFWNGLLAPKCSIKSSHWFKRKLVRIFPVFLQYLHPILFLQRLLTLATATSKPLLTHGIFPTQQLGSWCLAVRHYWYFTTRDRFKCFLSPRCDCCRGIRPHLPAGGDGALHVQAQGHLPHQRGQGNRVRRERRRRSEKRPRSPGGSGWEQEGIFHLRAKDFHGDFPEGINQKCNINRSTKRWIIRGYRRAS